MLQSQRYFFLPNLLNVGEEINLSSDRGSFSVPRMSLSTFYTLNVARADAVQRWYSDEVNRVRAMNDFDLGDF